MGYMKELDIRIKAAIVRCKLALAVEGIEAHDISIVGSTYIECKNSSDIDVLCFVKPREFLCLESMQFIGWEYGGSVGEGVDEKWASWKRTFSDAGEVNMLVTTDEATYLAWVNAAEVCKLLATCGIHIRRSVKCGIHDILMDGLCVSEVLAKQNPIVPL